MYTCMYVCVYIYIYIYIYTFFARGLTVPTPTLIVPDSETPDSEYEWFVCTPTISTTSTNGTNAPDSEIPDTND